MFMFFYFNHLHTRMAAWLSVLLACKYFLKPVISQSLSKTALPIRLSDKQKGHRKVAPIVIFSAYPRPSVSHEPFRHCCDREVVYHHQV